MYSHIYEFENLIHIHLNCKINGQKFFNDEITCILFIKLIDDDDDDDNYSA